jgi:hypothetical protein
MTYLNMTVQGGSDKSGIFFFLLLNEPTHMKNIRFYWSKNKLAEVHIENHFIIITAVSSNDSLDPRPQALAGLRHGVPVEEPYHLLYLLDQIPGFVARLCNDP